MKTFISILLFGLLGLLGCSGSNDGTSISVGEAIPVAPYGVEGTMTPTYVWTPVQYATRYRLIVVDEAVEGSTTQDSPETYVIDEWYTVEEAGCDSEDGLCMITPDTDVYGATWKVLACAGAECGLWSDELQFSFAVAGLAERFIDLGDGTVTDNNTRLMWTKNANIVGWKDWMGAILAVEQMTIAGFSDWRLPRLHEYRSVIDRDQHNPALPSGHPFTNVDGDYWTSDYVGPCRRCDGTAWYVNLQNGSASEYWKMIPRGNS